MKALSFGPSGRGPFRADQLRPGDPYELSEGHAIVCEPSGRRHGRKHLVGGAATASDPAVEEAGIEVGYVLDPYTLRAPDVSIGGVTDAPGFAHGAPALAVEYVEADRDELDLERKIEQLLGAGTRHVWVVRLAGKPRVEVHGRGHQVDVKRPGEELTAPGVLRNAVPVEALYDRAAANTHMLRNLLERAGFRDPAELRAADRLADRREIFCRTLGHRNLVPSAAEQATIDRCTNLATLDRWLDEAHAATSVAELLGLR